MHRTRTIVVLLALGTILCAPRARAGEQKANAPAYRSWIDPHLSPNRRPDEIVGMVRTLMQRSRKVTEGQGTEPGQGAASSDPILSVDCVEGDDVGAIVGRSAIKMPGATLWVVRVRGRFIKDVPGGSGAQIENDTGYYVIDDATGQVVAVGSPADH